MDMTDEVQNIARLLMRMLNEVPFGSRLKSGDMEAASDKIADSVRDVTVLRDLALICNLLTALADDDGLTRPFDNTRRSDRNDTYDRLTVVFWSCVSDLMDMPGREAAAAVHVINKRAILGEGPSATFKLLLERRKYLRR